MRKCLSRVMALAAAAVFVAALPTMVSAATLVLDDSSEFFGQRGGGVSAYAIHGTNTDFGHPGPVPNSPHAVDLYGEGIANIELTQGITTTTVGERLTHGMQLDFSNGNTEMDFSLKASLTVWGQTPFYPDPRVEISITDSFWNPPSYSNMAAKTNLLVVGNSGEAVKVHIHSWAESARQGDFTTTTDVGAPYPDFFSIWLNDDKLYDAGSYIQDPNGVLLDDFVIDAMAGDIVSIRAASGATLGGTVFGADFDGNYAWTNFYTHVSLEQNPVPIPGAVWLLGSGLLGLVAVRRRKKNS